MKFLLLENFTNSDRTPPYIDTYLQLFPNFEKIGRKRSPRRMSLSGIAQTNDFGDCPLKMVHTTDFGDYPLFFGIVQTIDFGDRLFYELELSRQLISKTI